jgi:alkanesulfonate monooxygenase SsuD/methylene tetrahydromethanopterin reductase-like flavin-dependent oxidoreductase (luciferase family)
MKFGVFTIGNVPKPLDGETWSPGQDAEHFERWLEQFELADALGFDYAWVGEHHFLSEYSHTAAADVFLAAVSQRTKRIRIGNGIVQMSHLHNPPARTAERVATLDCLSHGRYEFGSGAVNAAEHGPLAAQFDGEGERIAEARADWEESMRETLHMLAVEDYPGCDGRYVRMPPVTIVPRAVQTPHPPAWRSTITPDAARRIGELGLGCLVLAVMGLDMVRASVEAYWEGLRRCTEPLGRSVNPAIGAFCHAMVAETDAAAAERGLPGAEFFGTGLMASPGNVGRAAGHLARDIRTAADAGTPLPSIHADPSHLLIGSPASVRQKLRTLQETGIDFIGLTLDGGWAHQEHVLDSLRLFASEVMPEFHAAAEGHDAWRAERLAACAFPEGTPVWSSAGTCAPAPGARVA